MEQRVSVLTLGVKDLAVSRRFYVEVLGWTPVMEAAGEVVFFNLAPGLVLGLFTGLAEDAGITGRGPGLTALGCNVREKGDVDAVLARVGAGTRAGGGAEAHARVTREARDTHWGGRTGYFADPDGHLWEVAWNPAWPIGEDGKVAIKG